MFARHASRGFTLIEVALGVAILLALTAVVAINLSAARDQYAVDATSEEVITLLSVARQRTLASQNQQQWGVHFTASNFTLFKGPQYTSDPSSYQMQPVTQGSTIVQITLAGGGQDAIFERLSGTTVTTGTVRVEAQSNPNRQRTVYIEGSGFASVAFPPIPPARLLEDTRHVHYTIPWDIRTSGVMTLTWLDPPMPSVEVNITVASFITGNTFLWESDTNVNGSVQHLRIVSHSISANETILAIRRDRDENSKALTVAVDASQITAYDAGGAITPGAGITYQVQ